MQQKSNIHRKSQLIPLMFNSISLLMKQENLATASHQGLWMMDAETSSGPLTFERFSRCL